jgi:hypothetical protein
MPTHAGIGGFDRFECKISIIRKRMTTPSERRKSMAFRDLFLPKIAHSNPEKRKEAIREESDVALLKRVVENDSDAEVIETAKQRIAEIEA